MPKQKHASFDDFLASLAESNIPSDNYLFPVADVEFAAVEYNGAINGTMVGFTADQNSDVPVVLTCALIRSPGGKFSVMPDFVNQACPGIKGLGRVNDIKPGDSHLLYDQGTFSVRIGHQFDEDGERDEASTYFVTHLPITGDWSRRVNSLLKGINASKEFYKQAKDRGLITRLTDEDKTWALQITQETFPITLWSFCSFGQDGTPTVALEQDRWCLNDEIAYGMKRTLNPDGTWNQVRSADNNMPLGFRFRGVTAKSNGAKDVLRGLQEAMESAEGYQEFLQITKTTVTQEAQPQQQPSKKWSKKDLFGGQAPQKSQATTTNKAVMPKDIPL